MPEHKITPTKFRGHHKIPGTPYLNKRGTEINGTCTFFICCGKPWNVLAGKRSKINCQSSAR